MTASMVAASTQSATWPRTYFGHESGEGALCGTLVADEALVAMLNASGRVATDVDAQLVDVGRFHKPQASRHSLPPKLLGGMLGGRLQGGCRLPEKKRLTCYFGGGPPGARTRHLGIKSPLLYPMS